MRKLLTTVSLALLLAGCRQEASFQGKSVTQWRAELKDRDPEVRYAAAAALGNIGAKAGAAVPDLTEALKDPNDMVRARVVTTLWSLGSAAKDTVPDLIAALQDKNAEVRLNAAGALGSLEIGRASCRERV